ncbi:septum site-determining protein MinC [Roseomonas gilardii]|uniref:Probable septum site-determining protein MinC n=1 Tax=Roseomonas gilardii TaxID=257708 RepID=A0A1L7ADA1_9PROT|nr:septum site-determining protein MinC [Roseomonas gilardii]APT56777.1 septum site-determining protein MinC [Roseomonas gilardii]MDT8329604.1 septum site-determining protein MinC [Roseomonas gilardii]PZR11336.1 MAG: septum site-determining protein MinC [Azospirillum brasilense]
MSAQVANLRPGGAADLFRLRAANFSLLVLRLLDARVEAVVPAIADQFRRAPGFLRNAPIAIGLDDLEDGAQVDFETLIRELRAAAIQPIGTTGGSPALRSAALSAGLPPLRSVGEGKEEIPAFTQAPPAPEPVAPPEAPPARRTMIVDGSVRAGQRVWAQGCDLVINGTVNPGGEVIADGNVHVWGALKGRAVAGGAEDTEARVFALQFDPELVSIAGYYAVRDGLGDAPIGKAVQARLMGESMRFDRLG